MKNWFKKLLIPSGEKSEVIAYKSWIVRWKSVIYDGSYLCHLKDQSEIFPSEEDAYRFANSLKEANQLIKNKYFEATVEANQSKLASLTS